MDLAVVQGCHDGSVEVSDGARWMGRERLTGRNW